MPDFLSYLLSALPPLPAPGPGLAAAVALGLLVFLLLYQAARSRLLRRRAMRARRPDRTGLRLVPTASAATGVAAQMEAVALVAFETTPLLNREEVRLLPVIEQAIRLHGDGHRVMAQTSMGEILRPRPSSGSQTLRDAAYSAINAKRLDFAIIDRFGHLVAAIEYQGTGHYQSRAFMRDAVKREAVRKAGVPYIEIAPDFRPEEVTERLRAVLVPQGSAAR